MRVGKGRRLGFDLRASQVLANQVLEKQMLYHLSHISFCSGYFGDEFGLMNCLHGVASNYNPHLSLPSS
jgi:hypothetical protein